MAWQRREPYVETPEFRRTKLWVKANRSHGRCELVEHDARCVRPGHSVDHIRPKHLDGDDTPGNAQHLCYEHHQEKTQREAAAARSKQAALARYPKRKHPGLK